MKTAIIAGASGLVGGFLLSELLASPDYGRVVAVGRRPLAVAHPKLEQVTADFAALEEVADRLRGDDAFCCLGTTMRKAGSPENFRAVDHRAVLAFAWMTQRGGARRFFLVSALGANAGSRFLYNRVKGETEVAVGVMGFAATWIFRPSLLLGPRKEFRPGERVGGSVMRLVGPLLVASWRRYRAVDAVRVARAMMCCAKGIEARGVQVVESDEITQLGGQASGAGHAGG